MTSFVVKARKKGPITVVNVEAENREDAIGKTIATAAEGEEIEIFDAKEADAPPAGATGTSRSHKS